LRRISASLYDRTAPAHKPDTNAPIDPTAEKYPHPQEQSLKKTIVKYFVLQQLGTVLIFYFSF
jgi:hypothetical protein